MAAISLNEKIGKARTECAKATKEYASLKGEVVKAVQGKSKFQLDLLSGLVDAARAKMMQANEKLTRLNCELENSNNRIAELKENYSRVGAARPSAAED